MTASSTLERPGQASWWPVCFNDSGGCEGKNETQMFWHEGQGKTCLCEKPNIDLYRHALW